MTRPMFKDFLPEGLVSSYEVDEEAFLNTGGLESPFANDLDEGHMSEIMIGVEEYLGDMISRGIVDENEQLVLLNDRYHNLVSIDVIRRIKADKGDVEPADMYDAEITPNVNESIEVNEIRMLTEKLMKR